MSRRSFCFRKYDTEFFTTVAGGKVRRAMELRLQGGRDCFQTLITGNVAKVIIIGLKIIDISHDKSKGKVCSPKTIYFVLQVLVEKMAAGKSGKTVHINKP